MLLKNKKTGEIIEFDAILPVKDVVGDSVAHLEYASLAELNAEWEDVPEEPKKYYVINPVDWKEVIGEIEYRNDSTDKVNKEIGNYFETKEEAEKAVRKLKAWKRLKDKGFRFEGWTIDDGLRISICTNFDSDGIYDEDSKETKKDLDICFGGEE